MRKFLSFVLPACMLGMAFFSLQANATFLPRNNLHLYDRVDQPANMTEAQFNDIVDHIVEVFKPYAELHGATLTASRDWQDSTVNAYADQSGDRWSVHFYGGLARRKEVTPDGFAMVVCHELGHHFGGYAFYGPYDWAASEGESDYWATQVCARQIWGKATTANFRHLRTRPSMVQGSCEKSWKEPNDIGLCNRVLDAGLSLATLLASLGGEKMPKIDTPDSSQVTRTSVEHPEAQCRLDTYVAGALCTAAFDLKVIPGRDNAKGQDGPEAEADAAKYSCMTAKGYTLGARPRCWFKPYIETFTERRRR